MSVIALIATIPPRRRSCERLLAEISRQSRKSDGVILVLDGYADDAEAPVCPLPVIATHRTATPLGAGNRWLVSCDLPADDILVCLDDDIMLIEAPTIIEKLVAAVETGGGAAAAMGRTADGKPAPPGDYCRGNLIYAAGCGFTVRARHLVGLQGFATELRTAGGPDALGFRGDDDALVSAFLWKNGVLIRHAATGNIYAAPGTHETSQTAATAARRGDPNAQKLAIKKLTGWPWFTDNVGARRTSGPRA